MELQRVRAIGRSLLTAVLLLGAAASWAGGWRACKPPGAGFAVSMPGDVVHATVDAQTPFGAVRLYTWEASAGDLAFTALYSDYPAAVVKRNKADNILIHASDSIVAVTEGTLTVNRWLKVSGYLAREIEVVSAKTKATIRCRWVLAGTRLYQAMAARPRATEGAADVDRFFASFRLTSPAKPPSRPTRATGRRSG